MIEEKPLKVIVAIPLKKGQVIEPAIFELEGVDYFLVSTEDMTPTDGYVFSHKAELKQQLQKDDNITWCYHKLREKFLASDFDYFMTVESDIAPPLKMRLLRKNLKKTNEVLVDMPKLKSSEFSIGMSFLCTSSHTGGFSGRLCRNHIIQMKKTVSSNSALGYCEDLG